MSEVTSLPMPVYIFVDDKLAAQCTRKDAPFRVEAYKQVFPNANIRALSALMAGKAGLTIPKARSRAQKRGEDFDANTKKVES